MSLILVTPTHDRPKGFQLCEKWVSRQTLQPDEWWVIDSGRAPVKTTMSQRVIRREKAGAYTMPENILTALEEMGDRRMLYLEDDDWLGRRFFEALDSANHGVDSSFILTERIYNVRAKTYICAGVLPRFEHYAIQSCIGILGPHGQQSLRHSCRVAQRFRGEIRCTHITKMFQRVANREGLSVRNVFSPSQFVSIKGIRGRYVTSKHRKRRGSRDPTTNVLRSWVGNQDAELLLEAAN